LENPITEQRKTEEAAPTGTKRTEAKILKTGEDTYFFH